MEEEGEEEEEEGETGDSFRAVSILYMYVM